MEFGGLLKENDDLDTDFLTEYEQNHSSCDELDEDEEEYQIVEEEDEAEEIKLMEKIGLVKTEEAIEGTSSDEHEDVQKLQHFIQKLQYSLAVNTRMRDMLLFQQEHLVEMLQKTVEEKMKLISLENDEKQQKGSATDESDNSILLKAFYCQFAAPYFKDSDCFPCPSNNDYKRKLRNGELITNSMDVNVWREDEIQMLEEGVRKCLVEEHKEAFLRNKSPFTDKQYLKYLEEKGLAHVLRENPDREFDWMKISANSVAYHSPSECRKMWHLYVKPSLRHGKWSEEETIRLKGLSDKYNGQNWAWVATELNSGRSQLQCFVHYRTKLVPGKSRGKWSKEEDLRLNAIVADCRYGDFVHWPKVSYYMVDRTLSQIYTRWNNHLAPNLKKGKFSCKEDLAILTGILVHGLDPRDVAAQLGNRSTVQVRERFTNQLRSQIQNKQGDWTLDEDRKLLELVKEKGEKKWSEIACEFKTRNRMQIRHRYRLLKQKMKQDPEFDLQRLRRWDRSTPSVRAIHTRALMVKLKEKMKSKCGKGKKSLTNSASARMKSFRGECVDRSSDRRTYKDRIPEDVQDLSAFQVVPQNRPPTERMYSNPRKCMRDSQEVQASTSNADSANDKQEMVVFRRTNARIKTQDSTRIVVRENPEIQEGGNSSEIIVHIITEEEEEEAADQIQ